jgi:hypothetical protein
MSQMTPATARMVDPVVTQLATAYVNEGFVGPYLFPRVNVATRAGKIPVFDRESWRLVNSKHAPGADIPQVQVNYGLASYAIVDRILNAKVPVELEQEAAAVPNVNLRAISLQRVQDLIGLDLENEAATIARNASNYDSAHKLTLSGTTRWSQSTSTPINDVKAAKLAIRQSTGRNPNTLVLSESAFNALTLHQSFVDRVKYTSTDSVDVALIAKLFGVPNVYIASSSIMADDNSTSDMWGTDAVLAYVPKNGTYLTPAYGYTYGLNGYPYAGPAWWNGNNNSWMQGWFETAEPVLTGMTSGFLFVAAGS